MKNLAVDLPPGPYNKRRVVRVVCASQWVIVQARIKNRTWVRVRILISNAKANRPSQVVQNVYNFNVGSEAETKAQCTRCRKGRRSKPWCEWR